MKKRDEIDQWLMIAEQDLLLAKTGRTSRKVLYNLLCFHAQQSAEKCVKAVLLFYGHSFPKTHDIANLFNLLRQNNIEIPELIKEAEDLTDYATKTRYPGDYMPIDNKEYKRAIKLAEIVMKWAKSIIQKKSDKLF